jgi:Ribosomal RNA adenine dimethylase
VSGGASRRAELGQHFLAGGRLAAELVEQAGVGAGDLVVEIGAGSGVLTEALARRAGRVVAVERDPRLAEPGTAASPPWSGRRSDIPGCRCAAAWSRRSPTGSCAAWPTTSASGWTPGRPTWTPSSGPACTHSLTTAHLGRLDESP